MKQREREVKLLAPQDFELPPLADADADVFAGPPERVELDATYYDTDDLRLARAGATVRHRSDEGWVVKLPALRNGAGDGAVLARDEHHFGGKPGTMPPEVPDLVHALRRDRELGPVAELHTTRTTVRLQDAQGRDLAVVTDDLVQVAGATVAVPSFRELEVELTDATTKAQRTFVVDRLRAAGAGDPDPTPKLVRALGWRAGEPADVVVPAAGHPPQAGEVVRYAIAASVAKLVQHDPGVRIGDDAEDVHQARVATRRLRSHLRTFRRLVDEQWAEQLRDELAWLADVLGGVRDADVLLERLAANIERLPEPDREPAERLLDVLRGDREDRRVLLLEAMRSPRYVTLLDRLVEAAHRPRLPLRIGDEDDAEILRAVVRRPWTKLEDAIDALPEHPSDDELHHVRIVAKRARYAAEAVEPAFGKRARGVAKAVTAVQDALGEHQDAVVAAEWLRRTAARTRDESVGFAAGQLAALEHAAAIDARDTWTAPWKAARKKRVVGWLL